MVDYIEAIRRESAQLLQLVTATPWDTHVPSCPGWSVADLTWHIAEVQHSWASVVADLLMDHDDIPELERPDDNALADLLRHQSAALVGAVETRHAGDACWSWHPDGRHVGWVRRRQAHEALIHRIDAELAAGTTHIDVDESLAADGVDEIVTLFLDASDIPDWSSFAEHSQVVELRLPAHHLSWLVQLGRFQGTSPRSGTTYDEEAIRVVSTGSATTVVSGAAADLDRWLWGRGSIEQLQIEGDVGAAKWIRTAARHATQ